MRNECPHCDGPLPCKGEPCKRAERITANIRAKGCDAISVRDAVHEACHAIQWGLKGKWTRDAITKKNPYKRQPSWGVRDEITARAVEALVMQTLGLAYDQDHWVLMMIMETLKFDRIALPSFDWAKEAIVARMEVPEIKAMADKIIEMFDVEPSKKKLTKPRKAATVGP